MAQLSFPRELNWLAFILFFFFLWTITLWKVHAPCLCPPTTFRIGLRGCSLLFFTETTSMCTCSGFSGSQTWHLHLMTFSHSTLKESDKPWSLWHPRKSYFHVDWQGIYGPWLPLWTSSHSCGCVLFSY